MAQNIYVSPNGVAKSVQSLYWGNNNGIAREIVSGYYGDANGIARQFYYVADPYAMLYDDGLMVFQNGNTDYYSGEKNLVSSYKIYNTYTAASSCQWNSRANNIITEYHHDNLRVKSKAYWFANCYNLTGYPHCGNKVTDMY